MSGAPSPILACVDAKSLSHWLFGLSAPPGSSDGRLKYLLVAFFVACFFFLDVVVAVVIVVAAGFDIIARHVTRHCCRCLCCG